MPPRVEVIEAWRTGLALPSLGLEPTGRRPFVGITFKTADDEYLIPFSSEWARTLAAELESLCLEAEAQSN